MRLEEKTLEHKTVYKGLIVNVYMDRAELPNGKSARREVVDHPGGVAILPLLDNGEVVTVRQYRYPFGEVLLEVPAGKLDRGEAPEACALRELEEEVGLVPGRLIPLGALYVSPGFCNEVIHLYLARDLRPVPRHPDEDEFLKVCSFPLDTLVEQAVRGEIKDAKTVAAVLRTKWLLNA